MGHAWTARNRPPPAGPGHQKHPAPILWIEHLDRLPLDLGVGGKAPVALDRDLDVAVPQQLADHGDGHAAREEPYGEEMTQAVNRSLGMALAQLYVKKYFPEEYKE